MEENKLAINTVDDYIAQFPSEIQEILVKLRNVIKDAAPGAEEKISYQMPAFSLHGNLVYFAAFKNHIGFFPTPNGIDAFKDELSGYKCSKGTVQFPIGKPLPYDLVSRIVKYRVDENTKLAEEKKSREKNKKK